MKLTDLKYVSEAREKQLNKLGIFTQEDLLRLYPRDFVDLTHTNSIVNAYHNSVILTVCEVLSVERNDYARRPFVKAMCRQGDNLFHTIWFNQPYVAAKLAPGEYIFYGRVQNKYGMGASMVNPTFEKAESVRNLQGILPVYPLSGTLTQGVVRTAVRQALKNVSVESVIPFALQKKYGLSPLKDAFYKLHMPASQQDIAGASERIAIEEYFLLVSAFKVIKGDGEVARVNRYTVSDNDIAQFLNRFPFEFTEGQKAAVRDLLCDVRSPKVMNRLLQGDVGCGKTAVALTAAYMAVKSGFQAAMLSPTEVLARQNCAQLQKYLPEFDVRFLSGSTPAAEKRAIKKGLKDGTVDIVCGTHDER